MQQHYPIPLLPAIFWRPTYLQKSAWLEHVPFAFWIVEALQPKSFVELGTHYGVSYFAYCQAIERLGLKCRAYAVDTWRGDEHSGLYGDEVYKTVFAHNSECYSAFSRLVRSTFDEARAHFADGSIDLLHIDGLHTYEAVKHDFETWLPKLSPSAVVIFHDINVRERSFGVSRFFDELAQKYPSFAFEHGHGLGIIGVGDDLPAAVTALMKCSEKKEAARQVQGIFARLGQAVFATQDARMLAKELGEMAGLAKERDRAENLATLARDRDVIIQRLRAETETLKQHHKDELAALERSTAGHLEDFTSKLREALEAQIEEGKNKIASLYEQITALQEDRALVLNELHMAKKSRRHIEFVAEDALRSNQELMGPIGGQTRKIGDDLQAAIATQKRLLKTLREVRKQQNDVQSYQKNRVKRVRKELISRGEKIAQLETENAGLKEALDRSLVDIAHLTALLKYDNGKTKGLKGKRLQNIEQQQAITQQIIRIARSGLFDSAWYLSQYPDVSECKLEPIEHYVRHGAAEGRWPNPDFDGTQYIAEHLGDAATPVNPLLHFLDSTEQAKPAAAQEN
jgi:hypothetical protein